MMVTLCHYSEKETLSVSFTIMPQSVNLKYETPVHHTLTWTLSTKYFCVISTKRVLTKPKIPRIGNFLKISEISQKQKNTKKENLLSH